MYTENLYPPFEIEFAELDDSPVLAHKHTFFELVYIIEGTGTQCINNNQYNYKAGNMFLLTPADCHSFEVTTTTRFFFIKFNDSYIKSKQRKRLEYILHNASHQPGCILCNQNDKPLVKAVVQSLELESKTNEAYHNEIIDQLVNTMITIVARNIVELSPAAGSEENTANTIIDIINYIQQNIYTPDLLKAELLSGKFGISEGYLGRYFKKHTGESIQQYITSYKLKLVETRLEHSDMRINEIVTEFGFTDESHLNRLFKKHKGVNPTAFRKSKLSPGAVSE